MNSAVVTASLPWLGAVEHMGGPLPPNLELVEWNSPEPSEALADVEFVVPPFGFSSSPGALARLPRLRVVQTLTAGVDWILGEIPSGVTLCDARGVHDTSTAEWTVAAMLAAVRDLPLFARTQAEGRWAYQATDELAGKKVLIVGYGSIGAAIERRLSGFEVEVRRVARTAREGVASVDQLPTLLPQADVVVLVVPLTAQTRGMVDAQFLSRMHDGALLVNVARGPVVDTDALLAELASGRLRAALDVTDPEPLPEGHPLWSAPGCFITPHVAGSTKGLNDRAWRFVREQLERYVAGQPLANVVQGDY